ncbi:hypothetical protein Tco_0236254 [Tanacetum coccineum]
MSRCSLSLPASFKILLSAMLIVIRYVTIGYGRVGGTIVSILATGAKTSSKSMPCSFLIQLSSSKVISSRSDIVSIDATISDTYRCGVRLLCGFSSPLLELGLLFFFSGGSRPPIERRYERSFLLLVS